MTIFPEIIENFISQSIIKRSHDKNLVKYNIQNIRDFADSPHYKTDDYPFGGGDGMIFKPEPVFRTYDNIIENISDKKSLRVVFVLTKVLDSWRKPIMPIRMVDNCMK